MKKLIITLSLLLFCFSGFSQESYTINGDTLQLKTEVDGKLDLLWNIIDGKYRYFVKTEDNNVQELVNTKPDDSKFQEEYKQVLSNLTGQSTKDVDLTLFSLKEFIKAYNESATNVSYDDDKAYLALRLGFFGGLTNSPFVGNPDNTTVPFFGTELEFFEQSDMPRHAGFLGIRHAIDNDDFPYSETQISLGYRFRFINKPKFNIYGNVKLVTYSFSNSEFTFEDSDNPGTFITEKESESTFDAPLIFGLGADIKISENSFITLTYAEIFAAFLDLEADFPVDFAIGYKFNL